jgi:hypothetical protein
MELKDIKKICKEIVDLIHEGNKGLIYRKYDTLLEWFGMTSKRNFDILKKVDYQLRKHNVTIWVGAEQLNSVSELNRGETITFRLNGSSNESNGFANAG